MADDLAIPGFLRRTNAEPVPEPVDQQHSFLTVEAVKIAYRQTKEGDIVSFRIHPSDYNKELATAPLGTNVLLAVTEIKQT